MRKTKLSFDLFAQQHGNDGLFARFYGTFQPRSLSRGHSFEVSKYDGKNEVYPDLIQGQKIKAKRSAILLQKQVSKASIAKIVGVSLPPLSLYQDKTVTPTPLKDIFTPIWAGPLDDLLAGNHQSQRYRSRSLNIAGHPKRVVQMIVPEVQLEEWPP